MEYAGLDLEGEFPIFDWLFEFCVYFCWNFGCEVFSRLSFEFAKVCSVLLWALVRVVTLGTAIV